MEQTEKQTPKSIEDQRAEIIAKSKAKHPEAPESFHRIIADKYVPGSAATGG